MILDNALVFSSAQAVTASAQSTYAVDQANVSSTYPGSAGQSIAMTSEQAYRSECFLEVRVNAAYTGGAGTNVVITLQHATTNALLTSTPITALSSGTILKAALTANTVVWRTKLPTGLDEFLGVYYTTDGLTQGSFDAYLVWDPETNKF